eukprot:CAMPEP_0185731884 /NCGR_PEP_ID=MMETSP1171-20130828/14193_1 /TAXON_ID=374046 /ORGANISM="Helicotheca tamensis, Strain CCMP826" /LENGTH=242 /DNA_ID=CAMNT_0028401241 /DNA_START=233 /DNA_END=961 /DNA_ORIENTATION=+
MESKTNSNVEEEKIVGDPLAEIGLPSPIILGSGSFTRKLILKEMSIPYKLMVRPIDEKGLGDRSGSPHDLVSLLAKAKGDHLVSGIMNNESSDLTLEEREGGWIVLTGDQVVTHDDTILEKPESIEEAKDFVSRYAKSPPRTVGAVVLTHVPSMIQVAGVDSAQINFASSVADCDLIEKLLEEGAPVLDCAGGLMVEHPLVREHVEGIDGTEDSVMGLSKDLVIALLRDLKDKLDQSSNSEQ